MADDPNEDTWLYGNSNPEPPKNGEEPTEKSDNNESEKVETDNNIDNEKKGSEKNAADEMEEQENDESSANKKNDENGEDSDDSDDDDINVVIGDIKSGSSYNIKQRAAVLAPSATANQEKTKLGKFSIDEFECVGTISGVPAHEFSIDSLDDKPWRKPGADITDYFNYGFNEDTWRAYCERQKQMRLNESGVGLQGLSAGITMPPQNVNRTLTPLTSSDNNTYTATGLNMGGLIRRAGPPPGRKITGQIDVIGSNGLSSRRELDNIMKTGGNTAKENVIQVMTAERREYSRPTSKFDSGMPPPMFPINEPFYEPDGYNYGYEPTQEHQWVNDNPGWMPSGIKELTPGPQMLQPPQMVPPPQQMNMTPPMSGGLMRPPIAVPQMVPSPHMGGPPMLPPPHATERDQRDRERNEREGERGRDRERDRERNDRDRDRDRDRERGTDRDYRERSRDRGKSEESERSTRERDRYRERSTRRETTRDRSRSRERRRRSKSRDKERKKDKKKSHKKDKEDSE